MFPKVASIFIKAGIWLTATNQPILVWLVTVVKLQDIVTVQVGVTLISALVQNTLARGQNLDTYSSIVSNTHLSVHSGW